MGRRGLAATAFLAVMLTGANAHACELPNWDVSDKPAPIFYSREVSELPKEAVDVSVSECEPFSDVVLLEDEYTPTDEYYEPYTALDTPEVYAPTDGLTQEGGINYYDGRLESYYSSQVLPHYRQDEWVTDEEGYWRTSEGYYVVAASDMEQGTIFSGSKGECIVLDTGCAEGTTDYFVSW